MNKHRRAYVAGTAKEVGASVHKLETSVVPPDPGF